MKLGSCLIHRWWLLLLSGSLLLAAASPVYAQPRMTFTIHGFVWFDMNGNGQRDSNEPLLSTVLVTA